MRIIMMMMYIDSPSYYGTQCLAHSMAHMLGGKAFCCAIQDKQHGMHNTVMHCVGCYIYRSTSIQVVHIYVFTALRCLPPTLEI